ncbi:MAG: UDP-2,3-diacylglucosamine diphosphatase LpxI [Pseudomonadota bacterium]
MVESAQPIRWNKIGIIMGGGALPIRLAETCASRGDPFVAIRLDGYADKGAQAFEGIDIKFAEAGKLLRFLKEKECDAVTFAGLVPRPDFSKMNLDWRAAALLPRLIRAATRGDGELLKAIVDAFEAEGFKVIGADEIAGDLSAQRGPLGAVVPKDEDRADIKKAARLIAALGPYDVGQAAVVSQGLVLAIEAAEGTDAMLDRCAALPPALKGDAAQPRGVLVKRPKPGQELRIDLPTIGTKTIEKASRAGLAGIAIEAGHALVMGTDEVRAKANDAGIFIYGFTPEELE